MSQDDLLDDKPQTDDLIPEFSEDLVMDFDSPKSNGGLLSRLKGFFRKNREMDAFGTVETEADDPFTLQANEDAMFARRRRVMAVVIVVGLVTLIGTGFGLSRIDWSSHEEPTVASHTDDKTPASASHALPAPKAAHVAEDGGTRITHSMPVASGPEDLNKALIRPPGSYNPDAARRAGTMHQAPETAPKAASETTTAATGQPPAHHDTPQPAASTPEPESAAPPHEAPPLAVAPPVPTVGVPVIPGPRTDFSKHETPPSLTQLAKLEGVTFDMGPAPQAELQLRTPAGQLLPKIAPDGRKPWKTYALAHKADPGKPQIAVILRGLGLSNTLTTAAVLRMPPQVTLAFSPYADKLGSQLAGARQSGHETLLTLGLEDSHFPNVDPGPDGLFTALSVDEDSKRLETILATGGPYLGILVSGGDMYARSAKHMSPLLTQIKDMGLIYIAPSAAILPLNLVAANPAHGIADVVIPQESFQAQIIAYLRQVEDIARAKGKAILLVDATPRSLVDVATWMQGMTTRGFQFAPISSVVNE